MTWTWRRADDGAGRRYDMAYQDNDLQAWALLAEDTGTGWDWAVFGEMTSGSGPNLEGHYQKRAEAHLAAEMAAEGLKNL